jgi:predicted tellurium resistance membrane protein TerC
MIAFTDLEEDLTGSSQRLKSSNAAVMSTVLMYLVFSFDSILATIGLTNEIENTKVAFIVMAIAIVISEV